MTKFNIVPCHRTGLRLFIIPGLSGNVSFLQPPEDTTNVVAVIKGVIKAEENAITQYNKIINPYEERDYVTQKLAIQILGNEQDHHLEFAGFLKEYSR